MLDKLEVLLDATSLSWQQNLQIHVMSKGFKMNVPIMDVL